MYQLTYYGKIPKKTASKRFRDEFLEKIFILLSNPKDWVALEKKPSEELLNIYNEKKWIHSNKFLDKERLYEPSINKKLDLELIEFGDVREWLKDHWVIKENKWKTSAYCNSKIKQIEYGIENSILDANFPIFYQILQKPQDWAKLPWNQNKFFIIKEEFSSSGGHQFIHKKEIPKVNYPVLVEDYHPNRVLDFGILFQIHEEWEYLGLGLQFIGKEFQYLGSVFRELASWEDIGKILNDTNLRNYHRYLEKFENWIENHLNYFKSWSNFFPPGAVSWDGYILSDGRIRYRSEINYRLSLGRLALELRKKKNQEPVGFFGIFILKTKEKLDFPISYQLPISYLGNYQLVYAEGIK